MKTLLTRRLVISTCILLIFASPIPRNLNYFDAKSLGNAVLNDELSIEAPDALKANVLPAMIGLKPAEDPSTHFEDRFVKRDLQLSDLSRRAGEGAQPPRRSQRNDGTDNHPPSAVKPPPTGTTEVFHAPEGFHTSEFTSSSPFHQGTTLDSHALHRAIRLPGSVPNPGAATGSHFPEPFPLGTYSSNNPNPNPDVHHGLPATNSHFAGHSNVHGLQNPNPDVHHAAMASHFAGHSDVHGLHAAVEHAAVETISPPLDFGTRTPTTMGTIGWQPHHTDTLLSSHQPAPARPPSVGSSILSGSTLSFGSPSSAHPGLNPTDPSLAHHQLHSVATGQPPAAPHLGTDFPHPLVPALDLAHLYGHPNHPYEPHSGSFGIPTTLDSSSYHLGSAPGLHPLDPDHVHMSQFVNPIVGSTHLPDHLNAYPHSDGGGNIGGHIIPHTPVVAHASESNHGSLNSPSVHGIHHGHTFGTNIPVPVEDGAHAVGDPMDGQTKLRTPHGEVDMYPGEIPASYKSNAYSSHPMKEFGVPGAHGHDTHTGSPLPVIHDGHYDQFLGPAHPGGAGDINSHMPALGQPLNLDHHAGYPYDTSSLYSGHSSLASNAGSLPVTSTTGVKIEGQSHDLFSGHLVHGNPEIGAWDPPTPGSQALNDFGLPTTGAAFDLPALNHHILPSNTGTQAIELPSFTGTNVAGHPAHILGTMGVAHGLPALDHSALNTGTFTMPQLPTDPNVAGHNLWGTTPGRAAHHDLYALDHDLHALNHIGSHVLPSNTGTLALGQHPATGIDVNHATHHPLLGATDGAQHRTDTLQWPGLI